MSLALFEAIRTGALDDAKAALATGGADLANAKNDQGISALAFAVYNRKPEMVALLLEQGARLDVFTAAMTGNLAALEEMLAGNKSLVKLISADGWTPLHLSVFFGHPACAMALLNAGAEPGVRSTNAMRNLPLHAAAASRSFDSVKVLIDFGTDVNARQHGGWTALHAAAQNGDLSIAQLLLANGADAKVRADNNQTPMDLALTRGHQAMVDLLETHGAGL